MRAPLPTLTRALAAASVAVVTVAAAVAAVVGMPGPARAQAVAAPDAAAASEPVLTARLLELVNRARAEARDCGPKRYEAAPPLRRQRQLDAAARAHANDLAAKGEFDLRGSDGSTTETRVEREGYRWSGIGENLADRHFTPEPIVQGWLEDPMQCSNIMHPAFTEAGLARSPWEPGSRASIVWSMVVARPRGQPR